MARQPSLAFSGSTRRAAGPDATSRTRRLVVQLRTPTSRWVTASAPVTADEPAVEGCSVSRVAVYWSVATTRTRWLPADKRTGAPQPVTVSGVPSSTAPMVPVTAVG